MSALTETRDHARAMAEWTPPTGPLTSQCRAWMHAACSGVVIGIVDANCRCTCHPDMAGPTDAERALWTQIADEIDAHLAADDQPDLLGGES